MSLPQFWMRETGGDLRGAVEAYLENQPMTEGQIRLMRLYLRQWILAPQWRGPMVDVLRTQVNEITTRRDINRWLDRALDEGIDPL